jgi:plastocyanin
MKAWFRTSVVAFSVAFVALTGCARERSGNVHDGAAGADAVPVSMHDDAFEPQELRLDAGSEVRVEVRNEGSRGHNFTIDELNLSTGTVEPGSVVTATFVVPHGATGYHCTFHPGMRGEIVAR